MNTNIVITLLNGKKVSTVAVFPAVTDSETAWIAGARIEDAVLRALKNNEAK